MVRNGWGAWSCEGFGSLEQVIGLTSAGSSHLSGGGALPIGFAALNSVALLILIVFIAQLLPKLTATSL